MNQPHILNLDYIKDLALLQYLCKPFAIDYYSCVCNYSQFNSTNKNILVLLSAVLIKFQKQGSPVVCKCC
jgi:hypothetical protein